MKKIFTLFIAGFTLISTIQAQKGPSGTFVGPITQVICGNTQTANAFYYITLTADDYQDARSVAATTISRFENFYNNYPSFLSEFYNCRPLGCKPPAGCDSEARLIGITGVQLLPLAGNLYLLYMDINYKVVCLSCQE